MVIVSARAGRASALVGRKLVQEWRSMRADRAMLTLATLRLRQLALPCALSLGVAACDGGSRAPALSRTEEVVHNAPVPAENAPQLGVVSELLQVREFTDARAPSLGVLRAGARVPRSTEPVSRAGCAGGWYAIRPRGFVCVGVEATLDLRHPTSSPRWRWCRASTQAAVHVRPRPAARRRCSNA